ncbi:MAG TPA: glycerol kinase, partial [Ilumatobacteraceae bacterium]|nr:glycerol kinase [Ilumatobacteraceae bacterium]
RRPNDLETTALGAAYLAGLAVGVWPDLAAIASEWTEDAVFEPRDTGGAADATHALWRRAVERSRQWEQS